MISQNNVALVTGSTKGIGFEIAKTLLSQGWVVGINGRTSSVVNSVVDELGDKAIPVSFDVTNLNDTKNAISNFVKVQGRLDAVVHSAGIMRDAPLNLIDEQLLDQVFTTNVFGAFYVLKSSINPMMRKRSGSIVLLSSIVGETGARGQSVYGASKGAVSSLVKSASKELAPLKIRVNAIAPGPVNTELFEFFDSAQKEAIVSSIPLGRIGEVSDIAKLAAFLCSADSSYMTGQIIRVDGGLSG